MFNVEAREKAKRSSLQLHLIVCLENHLLDEAALRVIF
jgi:hypothetical protein